MEETISSLSNDGIRIALISQPEAARGFMLGSSDEVEAQGIKLKRNIYPARSRISHPGALKVNLGILAVNQKIRK